MDQIVGYQFIVKGLYIVGSEIVPGEYSHFGAFVTEWMYPVVVTKVEQADEH